MLDAGGEHPVHTEFNPRSLVNTKSGPDPAEFGYTDGFCSYTFSAASLTTFAIGEVTGVLEG